MSDVNRFAPEGTIWVCGACGKTSTDQYGLEGKVHPGWDASCALNAVLCYADKRFDENGLLTWHAVVSKDGEAAT